MRRFLMAAMMLLLIVPFPAVGQTGGDKQKGKKRDEQAVLKQLGNWIEALKRNDMTALNRIVAEDFMLVEVNGNVLNREQDLEPVKTGDLKFQSLTTEDVKVFVYGETAIVTGKGVYEITYKGKASTIRERFFDVFQKRKGQWRVIASRPTPGQAQ
jgi:ketosteroid isomerase-like protein